MSNQNATGAAKEDKRPLWVVYLPVLGALGIGVSVVYVLQVRAGIRWSAFGTAIAVAGAAALAGGMVGFLFGIPLHKQAATTTSTGETLYQANTNLEQVSDWLTKIIVGVGLVQLGHLLPALDKLARNLRAPLGGLASSSAFGLALAISYAALGFLFLYLWARERLPRQLQLAETLQQQLDKIDAIASNALLLVNQQFSSLKSKAPPTPDELSKAIAAAPDSTRLQIYLQAEQFRSTSYASNNKQQIELTIPVFKALIAADTDNQYYRNYGSLGWALKDKEAPDWRAARDALTTAINIRDRSNVHGWGLYEANRALCNINILRAPLPGDPSPATLTQQIEHDLDVARGDHYAAPMLEDTSTPLPQWIAEHPRN